MFGRPRTRLMSITAIHAPVRAPETYTPPPVKFAATTSGRSGRAGFIDAPLIDLANRASKATGGAPPSGALRPMLRAPVATCRTTLANDRGEQDLHHRADLLFHGWW